MTDLLDTSDPAPDVLPAEAGNKDPDRGMVGLIGHNALTNRGAIPGYTGRITLQGYGRDIDQGLVPYFPV